MGAMDAGETPLSKPTKIGEEVICQKQSGLPTRLGVANLSGANLRRANLISKADLSFTSLSGADLYEADLSNAVLLGADLRGANLSEASLSGADLREAHLTGADLCGAFLYGANLTGADLSWAKLKDAKITHEEECDSQSLCWLYSWFGRRLRCRLLCGSCC
jgi:Pentapeptide repeats (8 copies)